MAVNVTVSTERACLDIEAIHAFLAGSYWAAGISRERVEKSLDASLCFGMFAGGKQIGFARVVTDRATFAYLCDVYVDEAQRGHGLGKRLLAAVRAHPDLRDLRRFILWTRDAHGLYEQFGFARLGDQPGLMGAVLPFGYANEKGTPP
ncbi:MAG: GNAT family N-acetyltransferase [Solirubrobacteraceae bacterium]